MKARLALLLAALMLTAVAPSAPARPADCLVPGVQRTLEVKVKVLDKVVEREGLMRIKIRTYRPAQENFLEQGIDMPPGTPMEPAGDAYLTIAVLTANGYRTQGLASKTDSEGKALVRVRLEDHHKKGPGDVTVRAKIDHFSEQPTGTCVELQEGGYIEVKNAFVLR